MAKAPKPVIDDVRLIDRLVAVDYAHPDDLDDAAGDANWSDARVQIATGLKLPIERHVVMHELIHIIDESFGIGLKETQVQALAMPLMRLFVDNPHLVAYLAAKQEPT